HLLSRARSAAAASVRRPLCDTGGLHGRKLLLDLAQLVQQIQRGSGFVLVDPAHGKADVNKDPVPHARLERMLGAHDTGEADLPLDSADVDLGQIAFRIGDHDDLTGNSKTHGETPWMTRDRSTGGYPCSRAGCAGPPRWRPVRARGRRHWSVP